MKHIILFLFCISIVAGCSHPRHETLVYYYPATTETNNTAQATQTPQASTAAVQTNQTQATAQTAHPLTTVQPSQTTVIVPQRPVNVTTLYPAALPYTGTVTTYSVPAPQTYLFIGPSFGYYHPYRHYYRRHHYRRHGGFHPFIGFSGGWWW